MSYLLSSQQLNYPQSQIYEYVSPLNEDLRESREICSKNVSKGRKNKTEYSSPLWFRDDTKRLQRKPSISFGSAVNEIRNINGFVVYNEYKKLRNNTEILILTPIRKSISFGSSLNDIRSRDITMIHDEDNIVLSSPLLRKCNSNSVKHLRKKTGLAQNQNVFNSTMVNVDDSRNICTSSNATFDNFEKLSPLISRRNHTGQFKISNSWIDWTPFWSRDDESKRLDRRHYISDFFEI
ncbi:uncharacterized protein ACRADG_001150 isoform 2-T2 [Cochliomyia hominivorax]